MFRGIVERARGADDLAYGLVVIITARWILVMAGMMLALWNPEAMGELRISIVMLLGIALGNFFLHAQVIMRRPVVPAVAYAASVADLVVITSVIILGGGFPSIAYVFYLPALLAISVAFPTVVTVGYTAVGASAYGLVALWTLGEGEAASVFTRILMMVAVAFCGNVYWRIERQRRHTVITGRHRVAGGVREKVESH